MATEIANRIVVDPEILVGKPIVRGTRLSVEFILGLLADGWTRAQLRTDYPNLTDEDITACLAFARDTVAEHLFLPSAAA
jgi:uncharacterized protein (DUF433 family)